jgi:bacterioferritin
VRDPQFQLVVEHLQEALRWEHAGIVQMLLHGYRLGEHAIHSLESIARQDMRHFKWLAEHLVKLGEVPTLERAPVFLDPAAGSIWLARDVQLVEDALARYDVLLAEAGALGGEEGEDLVALIERLVGDKRDHRERVAALAESWQDPEGEPEAPGELDQQTHGFLDFAIGHEYEVILQYLHHGFLMQDQGAGRALEEIAIEEMRHLGWLSEALIDRGGCPYWNAKRVEYHDDAVRMLELDQQREIEVEADYQQMMAAMADPGIRHLFDRIGGHERYHGTQIGKLIKRLQAQQPASVPAPAAAILKTDPPPTVSTVGSLLGTPQPRGPYLA